MDRKRPGETRQSPVTWPPRPNHRCKQREKDGGGCGTRTRKTEVAGFQDRCLTIRLTLRRDELRNALFTSILPAV